MSASERIANIAIMGAGAIGSTIGGMLARTGHRVTLIGRAPHISEILNNGLHITGIWGKHTIFLALTRLNNAND